VFTYDAIGSYERTGYSCQGSGQALIMPLLDNQLKAVSPLVLPAQSSATPLSEAEAVDLVKDCFATAGERDIYTGDSVEILVINKDGIRKEMLQLKLD
jgi:20S proteasome subunit beta 6